MRPGARASHLGMRPDGFAEALPVPLPLDYRDLSPGQETMVVGGLHSRLQISMADVSLDSLQKAKRKTKKKKPKSVPFVW